METTSYIGYAGPDLNEARFWRRLAITAVFIGSSLSVGAGIVGYAAGRYRYNMQPQAMANVAEYQATARHYKP